MNTCLAAHNVRVGGRRERRHRCNPLAQLHGIQRPIEVVQIIKADPMAAVAIHPCRRQRTQLRRSDGAHRTDVIIIIIVSRQLREVRIVFDGRVVDGLRVCCDLDIVVLRRQGQVVRGVVIVEYVVGTEFLQWNGGRFFF